MSANEKQVGGDHYKAKIQHWDWAWANNLDYFQAQITKYVARHKKKNGLEDLKKAQHFLDKYVELLESETPPTNDPIGPFGFDPKEDSLPCVHNWRPVASLIEGASFKCSFCDERKGPNAIS